MLIATDIAARGIDVADIEHVINYDFPQHAEDYVHRIGRTARRQAEGVASSFVTRADGFYVRGVRRLIGDKLLPATVPVQIKQGGVEILTPDQAQSQGNFVIDPGYDKPKRDQRGRSRGRGGRGRSGSRKPAVAARA